MIGFTKNDHRKGLGGLIIIFSVAAFVLVVGGGWYAKKKGWFRVTTVIDYPASHFCTKEAKLCPDGKTSVGRTGPKCEFAECPSLGPCQGPGCGVQNNIDTSSWKTYRNEKYGFEVRYPSLLVPKSNEQSNEVIYHVSIADYFYLEVWDCTFGEEEPWVFKGSLPRVESNELSGDQTIRRRIVNGINGIEVIGYGAEEHSFHHSFYFKNSNYCFITELNPIVEGTISKEDYPDEIPLGFDEGTYKKIMSSFKLLK